MNNCEFIFCIIYLLRKDVEGAEKYSAPFFVVWLCGIKWEGNI